MTEPNIKPLLYEGALLVWGSVDDADDKANLAGLNGWWTNEHLPERLSISGFQRARQYGGRDQETGQQQYLTLYEVDNVATLMSEEYMNKLNNPTEGTKKYFPMLAKMDRAACFVVRSTVRSELQGCSGVTGGRIFMLEATLQATSDALNAGFGRLRAWFANVTNVDKDLLGCRVLLENRAATSKGSSSQSYQGSNLPPARQSDEDGTMRVILLIESTGDTEQHAAALNGVFETMGEGGWSSRGQAYHLLCSVSK